MLVNWVKVMTLRTGQARYPSTNYRTSNYCIAYLDILGVKNLICNDSDNKFLNQLNMFFKDAKYEATNLSTNLKDEIFVKIFSDNILFAIKIDDNDKLKKIPTIFNLVSNVSNEIFRYGYLTRGAITEGEFFHNDIILYGKALVDAVQMEETLSNYPRIVVQEKIVKDIKNYILLNKDIDGIYFLNTLFYSDYSDYTSFKLRLMKMLAEYKDNAKIRSKIMWTINYFNMYYAKYMPGKPQITQSEILNVLK